MLPSKKGTHLGAQKLIQGEKKKKKRSRQITKTDRKVLEDFLCVIGGVGRIDVTYRKVLAYVLVCNGPIIRSARERLFFIPASTLVSIEEMRSRVTLFRLKKANDWATAAALNNFLCDLLLLPRLISTGSRKLTGWNIRRQCRVSPETEGVLHT